MQVLSAAQALSPAIERTRRLLFQPFQWGTFLKLCAVAVFTEGFGGNFNFSSPGGSSSHRTTHFAPFTPTPGLIAVIVVSLVAAFAIGILLFYLVTRLRFALFHCLVHQVKEIRPGWQLYREQANRFFRFNLIVGILFLLVAILIVAPFAAGLIRAFASRQPGAQFDLPLFLSLFLPMLALLLALALVALVLDIVLRDFMLPHFALEDKSAGEAWADLRTRFAAERGSFFLYAILRVLLPIAAMIALFMVLAIPMLIVFGILAALFAGFHIVFADATGGIEVLRVALEVILGLAAIAIGLLLAICFGGPLSLWVRNFALVFYGGRYPLLGNILFPPAPTPFSAPREAPTA